LPSYKDLMPSLNPLQNTIRKMTDFTLPNGDLNSYFKRAGREAANQTAVQRKTLQDLATSLANQRKVSLNNLQRNRSLLPDQFSQQLQEVRNNIPLQEQARGVAQSGLGLRNFLLAGISPLAQQANSLQRSIGQHGQIENEYLNSLLSNVFHPQRTLALQQGEDASKRYQTLVQQAQQSLFNGRISEAENLLMRAQLEYNSLIKAQEESALRQQMQYQRQLNDLQQSGVSGGGGGNFSKYRITSNYGGRKDPITGKQSSHSGVDFATPMNTPISATTGGTVIRSGSSGSGYGNYVVVKDDNNFVHIYAHLNSTAVRPGTRINAGQIIGRSGNTGRTTGPHLHYEVRRGSMGGSTVNPMGFV